MATYTVKQLARLSGVSVRALHHYDEIGLLVPSFVGENRYRYYGREELLRLQDILVYRDLGVPLARIARFLAVEDRDRLAMLTEHRALLADRVKRSRQLLRTIDATIAELQGEGKVTDRDLYKGFAPEKQAEYEEWLVGRYGGNMGERIAHSKAGLAALGEDGMKARLAEGDAATQALVAAFAGGAAAGDPANRPLLARHHGWVARRWNRPCPPQAYAGLADMYLEHPDFRANFEQQAEGFTDWLAAAMKAYAAESPA